ncbi:rhodanese-like protein [[Eubacterium] yurii subsp. margaretiae ATCC 43715]|nr:rhodanese-like protein [[Eubacterium] yurii subsp. margaretiae ATCC 43715]
MKPEELQKMQYEKENPSGCLLIDVREKEEYDSGHFRYAINYPVSDIMTNNKKLVNYKDKPVFVHCHSGGRSAYAKMVLSLFGFKNVKNVGGITAYNYDLITTHTNLCVSQFIEKIKEDNIVIVDTRSKEEYESWNVPKSINIQIDKIEENIDNLPKERDIVIYSSYGYDGVEFAEKLASLGYKNIYNLISKAEESELC